MVPGSVSSFSSWPWEGQQALGMVHLHTLPAHDLFDRVRAGVPISLVLAWASALQERIPGNETKDLASAPTAFLGFICGLWPGIPTLEASVFCLLS